MKDYFKNVRAIEPPPFEQCRHESERMTKRQNAAGGWVVRKQCLDCGWGIGPVVRHAQVQLDQLPVFDEALERAQRGGPLAHREHWAQERSVEWWTAYNAYLRGPEWKAKRALVLSRDGGICQGCLLLPATQVHHLSYEHAGNEFAWELRSICDGCHERMHHEEETGR